MYLTLSGRSGLQKVSSFLIASRDLGVAVAGRIFFLGARRMLSREYMCPLLGKRQKGEVAREAAGTSFN